MLKGKRALVTGSNGRERRRQLGGIDPANARVQRANNLREARQLGRGHQGANTMRGQAMTRYEYKFVRVELKSGLRTDTPKEDYQQIVHDHAKEGWRLFQIFAPATSGTGWASYIELIFERPQT
jgi:hypothetical protein